MQPRGPSREKKEASEDLRTLDRMDINMDQGEKIKVSQKKLGFPPFFNHFSFLRIFLFMMSLETGVNDLKGVNVF